MLQVEPNMVTGLEYMFIQQCYSTWVVYCIMLKWMEYQNSEHLFNVITTRLVQVISRWGQICLWMNIKTYNWKSIIFIYYLSIVWVFILLFLVIVQHYKNVLLLWTIKKCIPFDLGFDFFLPRGVRKQNSSLQYLIFMSVKFAWGQFAEMLMSHVVSHSNTDEDSP